MKSQAKVNQSVFPSFTDVTDVGKEQHVMPAAVILHALRFLKKEILIEILQQCLSLLDMHF